MLSNRITLCDLFERLFKSNNQSSLQTCFILAISLSLTICVSVHFKLRTARALKNMHLDTASIQNLDTAAGVSQSLS